jgi:hypothetical protein
MNHFKKSNRVLFVNPAYAFMPSAELVLKADEMWLFIGKKKVLQWLWWVEDSSNGQIIAFIFGPKDQCYLPSLKENAYRCGCISYALDYRPVDCISGLPDTSRAHCKQS